MERFTDIDQEVCDAARASLLAEAEWGDSDLTARIDENGFPTDDQSGILFDRSDRESVCYYQAADGSYRPTKLKIGDDVLIAGCIPARCIGAARSHYMASFISPWFGACVMPFEVLSSVTDRAPLAPEEGAPFPLVPEAEQGGGGA